MNRFLQIYLSFSPLIKDRTEMMSLNLLSHFWTAEARKEIPFKEAWVYFCASRKRFQDTWTWASIKSCKQLQQAPAASRATPEAWGYRMANHLAQNIPYSPEKKVVWGKQGKRDSFTKPP